MKARERVATWGSALPARSQRSTFGLRVSYIALSAYSPPPLLTEERSGRSEARADALSGALRVGRASCAAIASRIWALLAGRGTGSAAAEMSYGSSSIASGAKTATRTFDFGRTHVVRPKGRHLATVVWLHGLGDNGASWSQLLETLPLPNIKWICPTAPTRPVAIFGGFPSTSWFDVTDLSEDGPDDIEGLDASAAHVANLLSTEPADIKLGVGGFSMGAATALYSATSCAHGTYGNGKPYPVNLSSVVGLSGWLPCARSLKSKLEGSQDAARRASSLPILLCHGKGDEVVLYKHGERSAQVLKSNRFENVTFKTYNGLGHYTVPGEMDDVCKFLTATGS
ncbi:acyl-protein thioesterase [Musa troglodytarum]|uniref:Acyl-protein thioesterase n=1 Tax=Musa troglodytarum TaxID=320322 RepID=A0A9E7G4E9_9LILI|nr:acyl-protein thioesterase [Musa troglodytarum]